MPVKVGQLTLALGATSRYTAAMGRRLAVAARVLVAWLTLLVTVGACGGAAPLSGADPLRAMREAAHDSDDGDVVGRWLLGELLLPGGQPSRAKAARARLEALGDGKKTMFGALARAIDDEAHGRFHAAAAAHLDALAASRSDTRPDAPLVGWFAANHLLRLRGSVQNLWESARTVVERTLEHPGNVGWRARSELVEWWSIDGLRTGATSQAADPRASILEVAAKRYGCVENARMAGPFGRAAPSDHRVRYAAERPGPWPPSFERDARRVITPRVLPVERRGCQLRAASADAGVYYVETFIDLPAERQLIVAAQGAFAIFVDDHEVLTRDTRTWGIWPRFGAQLRLGAGRHRILARVGGPETSIRLMAPNGMPLAVPTSADASPPYEAAPPQLLSDPNPLEPFLTALGVKPQPRAPRPAQARDTNDPVSRYLAAYLAHVEGQQDVSAVLLEPLVKEPSTATGPALAAQAVYLEKDPIFGETDARDLVKDVRARASSKDPDLWWAQLWLVLDAADKSGLPDAAPKVAQLADRFREVPDILKGLAAMYARLGWKAEHARTVNEAATRFPDDLEVLTMLLRVQDEQGRLADADKTVARIRALNPDAEVDFERAVERRDWEAAIKELERLGKRRQDRRDIAARIADLLVRSGRGGESLQKLELALKRNPADAGARLALADARLARGDRKALQDALIDAIQSGSDTGGLRDAIELVDGVTELSTFRVDARKVIADFEQAAKESRAETRMQAPAARVLDYAALYIHEDGSARMLEHEVICIQSREAIQEHAEQQMPRGMVLRLRTIKRDGRILEPEIVEGKPTVTMPHLEVGDYIETESIMTLRGEVGGRTFTGPRWFFREEKMAYWLSEFVVVSPKTRPLVIETAGAGVPTPVVQESGALVTRRWRVDKSPALPEEPASAPISEFLPNVRAGWGVTLDDVIGRMIDATADETPRDPRLLRVAQTITSSTDKGPPAKTVDDKARRIYRWVLSNVEPGRESDPRRVIIGKSGNRAEAFLYLCRLLGIDASIGVVRDRLTPPPIGPLTEAETFTAPAIRLVTESGPRWMVVRDKYAPYGYLPSSMRAQPAVVLVPGAPRETTASQGARDGITHEGQAVLAADGSAKLDLAERFEGKFAIGLRSGLESLPEGRLKETIESRLLPQMIPGARLARVEVQDLSDLDDPLTLAMKVEVTSFGRPRGGEIVLSPPFQVALGALVALPSRETPLYVSEQMATSTAVKLRIKLPAGARVTTPLAPWSTTDEDRVVRVADRVEGDVLVLDRSLVIPAGRVQPEKYAAFQEFARRADAALLRDIVIALPGRSE